MKQVKEEGWEVLSSPSADAMPRIASWSFSFSVCSHRPDLGVRETGGQCRLMHFQSPLSLLFSPKCFGATVCIIY